MDKIQELTSKLYSEGVEKGKEEAVKILEQANARKPQGKTSRYGHSRGRA